MRAWLVVVVVAAGLGAGASATALPATRIVGGSAAQRAVLRDILTRLSTPQLAALRIVPVAGGVKLETESEAARPTWEALVAGRAFLVRSASLGLPPLLEVVAGRAGWPSSDLGPSQPRPATAAGAAAARTAMLRAVAGSGARVAELSVTRPYGLAVAIRLEVKDAAGFMHRRLRAFVLAARAHASRYEGTYLEVDDSHGPAWVSAEAQLGGTSYVRPSLLGCDPFPPPGLPGQAPPCPA